MKKKTIALILSCVLVLGCAIGGTIAWLTDVTGSVTNTFTVGDINIDLYEHVYNPGTNTLATGNTDNDITREGNSGYRFVPGTNLPKDPTVVVEGSSEACYLFIHVVATNWPSTSNISYSVDDAVWNAVDGHPGYFYREVEANVNNQPFTILKSNTITVSTDLTKDEMKTIGTGANAPKLTFTACAVQKDNIADVTAAWASAPDSFTGATGN